MPGVEERQSMVKLLVMGRPTMPTALPHPRLMAHNMPALFAWQCVRAVSHRRISATLAWTGVLCLHQIRVKPRLCTWSLEVTHSNYLSVCLVRVRVIVSLLLAQSTPLQLC